MPADHEDDELGALGDEHGEQGEGRPKGEQGTARKHQERHSFGPLLSTLSPVRPLLPRSKQIELGKENFQLLPRTQFNFSAKPEDPFETISKHCHTLWYFP